MSIKSWLGPWRILEKPDMGSDFWYWFGYGHWSIKLIFQILAVHIGFEGAKNIHVLYFLFGLLRKYRFLTGVWNFWSWFVCGYWSLTQICSKFRFLHWFCSYKEHPWFYFDWSFRGWCWRFLTEPWNIDFDLYVFNGHGNTQGLTLGPYIDFLGCKDHLCPLSPDLGFCGCWRFLTRAWSLHLGSNLTTQLGWNYLEVFIMLS